MVSHRSILPATAACSPRKGIGEDLSSLVDFRTGIVSCLGNTLDDVADSLYNARSGIKHMPKYAEIGMKSQVAGRPELDLNDKETIGAIWCANHTSRHFSPDLHAIDATPAR